MIGTSSEVGTELCKNTGDRDEHGPCIGNVVWSCHFTDACAQPVPLHTVIGPYLSTLPMASTEVMATAAATRQDRGGAGTGTWPHPFLFR